MLWATPSPPSLAALSPQFIFPAPLRVFIHHRCFSPGRSGFLWLCALPAATKRRRAVRLVSLLHGLSSRFGGAFANVIPGSLVPFQLNGPNENTCSSKATLRRRQESSRPNELERH